MEYNGLPIFDVDECDFILVAGCKASPSIRLLAKQIVDPKLREFYLNSRTPMFAVRCDGIIVTYGEKT